MSAHNPPSQRRPVSDADEQSLNHDDGYVSTRILLDSSSEPTCDACGRAIEMNSRHKCLTVRDEADRTWEFTFCDENCLAAER